MVSFLRYKQRVHKKMCNKFNFLIKPVIQQLKFLREFFIFNLFFYLKTFFLATSRIHKRRFISNRTKLMKNWVFNFSIFSHTIRHVWM